MFHLFKKKIGLALGAGSAKGLAHIGVIKELEKNNIAIDYIAGTSIGAIVGGFYAYTKNIKALEELAYSQGYKEMFDAFFDPSLKSGVFKGEKVLNMLGGYIPDDVLIQDTKIPFYQGQNAIYDQHYLSHLHQVKQSHVLPITHGRRYPVHADFLAVKTLIKQQALPSNGKGYEQLYYLNAKVSSLNISRDSKIFSKRTKSSFRCIITSRVLRYEPII